MATSVSLRQGRFNRLGSFIPQRTGRKVKASSIAIDDFKYDRKTKALEVTFESGARYQYGCVPATVFREMVAVARDSEQSLGAWFVQNIRGTNTRPGFPFRRLVA